MTGASRAVRGNYVYLGSCKVCGDEYSGSCEVQEIRDNNIDLLHI